MLRNDIYKILEEKMGNSVLEYRNNWEEASNCKRLFDFPLHLNFELISGCNLKCEYCVYSSIHKKKKIEKISFDAYCKVIDECIDNNLCSIELNGINEPFLQKDIIKYIKYAKEAGILIISLHTNARLLNNKIIEDLINSGVTLVVFSLDAINKDTYEKIRKGSNYKKVMENINTFLEMKKKLKTQFPLCKVSFVRNKLNYKEFDQFFKYWENKIDYISSSSFCNPFVGEKKYKQIENKYRFERFIFTSCSEPYQRLFISSNGEVYPCCSFFGNEMKVGNIYENSILDIWNSKKMQNIRQLANSDNTLSACKKCRISMTGENTIWKR